MTEDMEVEKKEAQALKERKQRGFHFHWQNLKREDSSCKWLHGRFWLSKRPHYHNELNVEWVVPGSLDFTMTVGGDMQLHLCIGLLLFTLYINLDRFKFLRRWETKVGWQGREISFSVHDWALWWRLWLPEHEWSAKTSKWRDGTFHIDDFFLGKNKYTRVEQEPIPAVLSLPEGDYPVTVKLFEQTWKRPRWPWPKQSKGAWVDASGHGIPIPGKGENAWDCDDDAYLSIGTSALTVEEAIEQATQSVQRRRKQYGGKDWLPEKVSK